MTFVSELLPHFKIPKIMGYLRISNFKSTNTSRHLAQITPRFFVKIATVLPNGKCSENIISVANKQQELINK